MEPEHDRISQLEARIEELEARLAAVLVEPQRPGPRVAGVPAAVDTKRAELPAELPQTDRRTMLRTLGLAGAAAAASTAAAVASATPAAAVDGGAMLIGTQNVQDLSDTTTLRFDSFNPTGGNVMTVVDTHVDTNSLFPAAIGGYSLVGTVANGVYGYTATAGGAGLVGIGETSSVGAHLAGGRANVHLHPAGLAPRARVDSHVAGDVVMDSNSQLWVCVGSGSPGSWRLLAAPDTISALHLHDAPVRAYDSRAAEPPLGGIKGRLLTTQFRPIDLKAAGGVPNGAVAALVNLTATGTSTSGYLRIYKAGAPVPASSSINWDHTGTIVANTATVALNANEECTVQCGGGGAATDFIVDVIGYYL